MKIKENGSQSLQERLVEQIQQQIILLLLDNFDRLLPAANLVAELLSAAPGLRILTTSRTPLYLSNEHLITLKSLSLPEFLPDAPWEEALPELSHSDAVRLFVSCSRTHAHEFTLSETTGPLVAEICQRLDGLPLAIELAAAQGYRMRLETVHSYMEHQLDILTEGLGDFPPPHQALRSAFEWSFEHLQENEKRLFPHLGVFAGSFTLDEAKAVSNVNETEYALEGLVDKNMLYRVEESRYGMLETIREFAIERLETAGIVETTRYAHLEYYTHLVEAAEPHLWNNEQEAWSRRLIADLDNIRAALHWSLERQDAKVSEIELGARIAGRSWYFWYLFGRTSEARRWLEIALQKVTKAGEVRAKLLLALGSLVWRQGDLPTATQAMRASVDLYRLQENELGLADSSHILGHLVFDQQHYHESDDIFRESLALYESLGNQVLVSTIISDLGMVACHLGDLQAAEKYYQESLFRFDQLHIKPQKAQVIIRLGDIARHAGDDQKAEDFYHQALTMMRALQSHHGIAWATQKLGYISLHRGEIRQAQALFTESLALQSELSNQQGIAESLAGLASSMVSLGEGVRAARIFGAAKGILKRTGLPMAPVDLLEWQRDEGKARASCDLSLFEKAWAEGEVLNLKQAIELANAC